MERYYFNPVRVRGRVSRARYEWIRALIHTLGRAVGYDDILTATIREGQGSPFWETVRGPDDASLINYAMRVKLRGAIRGIRAPVEGIRNKTFRVLISTKIRNQLVLAPPPYIIDNPPLYRAALDRAAKFRNAWQQHYADLRRLQRLPAGYWR